MVIDNGELAAIGADANEGISAALYLCIHLCTYVYA